MAGFRLARDLAAHERGRHRRRRAPRPRGDAEEPAPVPLLRRRGLGAVRAHHAAAGVLPDRAWSARSSGPTRASSSSASRAGPAALLASSSWALAAPRRPRCCCGPSSSSKASPRTCRSTSRPGPSSAARRRLRNVLPEVSVRPLVMKHEQALLALREQPAEPSLVMFIGSSVGNFEDDEASALLRRPARRARRRHVAAARHRPAQGPRGPAQGVRRRGGRHRGVQPQRAHAHQSRAGGALRPRSLPPRGALERRGVTRGDAPPEHGPARDCHRRSRRLRPLRRGRDHPYRVEHQVRSASRHGLAGRRRVRHRGDVPRRRTAVRVAPGAEPPRWVKPIVMSGTDRVDLSSPCSHVTPQMLRKVHRPTPGCEECLKIGGTWVASARVPVVRPRRVLRLVAPPARDRAQPRHAPPRHHLG